MFELRLFLFWSLAPLLAVLLAAPVFIGHVVVHLLIDRMRRDDPRRSTPKRTAVATPAGSKWESPSSVA